MYFINHKVLDIETRNYKKYEQSYFTMIHFIVQAEGMQNIFTAIDSFL